MIGTKSYSIEQCDDVTIVHFVDTSYFDTDEYAQLQHDLRRFVARERPRMLLVDLSDVQYCSTALTNALLTAQNCIESWGGTMQLVGLTQGVLETLEHLNLVGTVFSLCDNELAAKYAS